jgi:hypothetical protein
VPLPHVNGASSLREVSLPPAATTTALQKVFTDPASDAEARHRASPFLVANCIVLAVKPNRCNSIHRLLSRMGILSFYCVFLILAYSLIQLG